MASYRLSNKADNDIAEHYEYGILNFGLGQAREYLLGLHQKFQTLAENPLLGRSATEIKADLRRLEYGSHVVFYLPEQDGVLIVRVLRKEMDFVRHL